jgi:hypothetical protein
MSSEIKVSSVKAKDGTAGISIADSTGRVTFTETNPSITLGSNTTFPTGHVLQTVSKIATTNSDSTSNAEIANISGDSTSFEKEITITSGNKVLVIMNGIVSFAKNSTTYTGGSVGIYVTQSGSTTAVYDETNALGTYVGNSTTGDFNVYQQIHLSVLHSPSVTNPTYKPYLRPYSSSALRLRCTSGGFYSILLQEIQA